MKRTKMNVWLLIFLSVLLSVSVLPKETANAATKVTTQTKINKSTKRARIFLKYNVRASYRAYQIPGLNQTVTKRGNGKAELCRGMIPQGMCFAYSGKYVLISAYCMCGKHHNSVLYVLDGKTKKLLTTLILDSTSHVGGIAECGSCIWVCNSGECSVQAYKRYEIKRALHKDYLCIKTAAKRRVAVTPAYLCVSDGYLYEGKFGFNSEISTICYYKVSGTKLKKKGTINITGIANIQGISIRGDKMVVTSSHGRTNASVAYVFRDEKDRFRADKKRYDAGSAFHYYRMPNMIEGCYIGADYTYFIFESGAAAYRKNVLARPFDKFIRFRNKDIL